MSKIYIVLQSVEGMSSQYSYVFDTKKAALLMVANILKDNDLKKQITQASTDEELDEIEKEDISWDGVDLQVQVLNSTKKPTVGW